MTAAAWGAPIVIPACLALGAAYAYLACAADRWADTRTPRDARSMRRWERARDGLRVPGREEGE